MLEMQSTDKKIIIIVNVGKTHHCQRNEVTDFMYHRRQPHNHTCNCHKSQIDVRVKPEQGFHTLSTCILSDKTGEKRRKRQPKPKLGNMRKICRCRLCVAYLSFSGSCLKAKERD